MNKQQAASVLAAIEATHGPNAIPALLGALWARDLAAARQAHQEAIPGDDAEFALAQVEDLVAWLEALTASEPFEHGTGL